MSRHRAALGPDGRAHVDQGVDLRIGDRVDPAIVDPPRPGFREGVGPESIRGVDRTQVGRVGRIARRVEGGDRAVGDRAVVEMAADPVGVEGDEDRGADLADPTHEGSNQGFRPQASETVVGKEEDVRGEKPEGPAGSDEFPFTEGGQPAASHGGGAADGARLASGGAHQVHGMAFRGQAGQRAPGAEGLVVGMREQGQNRRFCRQMGSPGLGPKNLPDWRCSVVPLMTRNRDSGTVPPVLPETHPKRRTAPPRSAGFARSRSGMRNQQDT